MQLIPNVRLLAPGLVALALAIAPRAAFAQEKQPPADESALGEFVVTGTQHEHVTRLAILPSLSPDMADVIVRGVVRRDFELTGMFDVIPDKKAPEGLYGFNDPVDIDAWKKLGAEVIVKVAARSVPKDKSKVQVFGLCYFLNVGKDPVYQKTLIVDRSIARVTAHRITDALLGAITGRPGGFASHFTFSGKWGKNARIFTMDSDGNDLKPVTSADVTAIAPTWGPGESVFYTVSKNYAPFKLMELAGGKSTAINLPFKTSVYSVDFNKDKTKMAVAIAGMAGSAIYVGNPDGSGMKKVSTTPLATHPVWSPSGKLAWIGGGARNGTQRVYVDGKAVSPMGFTAAAPTFCDTEDGIRLIYAVEVRGNRQDLVMSGEKGGGTARLTQHQGSNSYPACSPDGRMLAFFSTRGGKKGMYFMSLKRWKTQLLTRQYGQSLRWDALPPPPKSAQP